MSTYTRIEQISIHEAGHAIASLEAGRRVTELRATFTGGVCRFDDHELSYQDNLRISLGGIAAEKALCGNVQFSNRDDELHARKYSVLGFKAVERQIDNTLYSLQNCMNANRDAVTFLARGLNAAGGTLDESEIGVLVWSTGSPLWKYRRLYQSPKPAQAKQRKPELATGLLRTGTSQAGWQRVTRRGAFN